MEPQTPGHLLFQPLNMVNVIKEIWVLKYISIITYHWNIIAWTDVMVLIIAAVFLGEVGGAGLIMNSGSGVLKQLGQQ